MKENKINELKNIKNRSTKHLSSSSLSRSFTMKMRCSEIKKKRLRKFLCNRKNDFKL